ncbi:MAG: SRPBCC family protein [Actinomycetota bacterium]|nr:SRPBCC family protein [Actinomycetota bacterium]
MTNKTFVRGSVRRSVRIKRSAEDVWEVVGDPKRITEWFPGIVSAKVDGDRRVVTTVSGLPMPEQILTIDHSLRRFQYRITTPIFKEHLSTIDVIDMEDETALAIYSVDAEPAMMAIVIGASGGNALEQLKKIMEVEQP